MFSIFMCNYVRNNTVNEGVYSRDIGKINTIYCGRPETREISILIFSVDLQAENGTCPDIWLFFKIIGEYRLHCLLSTSRAESAAMYLVLLHTTYKSQTKWKKRKIVIIVEL